MKTIVLFYFLSVRPECIRLKWVSEISLLSNEISLVEIVRRTSLAISEISLVYSVEFFTDLFSEIDWFTQWSVVLAVVLQVRYEHLCANLCIIFKVALNSHNNKWGPSCNNSVGTPVILSTRRSSPSSLGPSHFRGEDIIYPYCRRNPTIPNPNASTQ